MASLAGVSTGGSFQPTTTTATPGVNRIIKSIHTLHLDQGDQHKTNFEWMRRGEIPAGWRVEKLRLRKTSFQDQSHNEKNSKSLHHFSSAASKEIECSPRTNGELFLEFEYWNDFAHF